jgi:hypothetical protein
MTSEQIWALAVGLRFSAYGTFILSHVVCSHRRPLRWGKAAPRRVVSRPSIILTGGAWLAFGMAALASIFLQRITPIALSSGVAVLFLAYLVAGTLDAFRR